MTFHCIISDAIYKQFIVATFEVHEYFGGSGISLNFPATQCIHFEVISAADTVS